VVLVLVAPVEEAVLAVLMVETVEVEARQAPEGAEAEGAEIPLLQGPLQWSQTQHAAEAEEEVEVV
jgi:hypothetical protein